MTTRRYLGAAILSATICLCALLDGTAWAVSGSLAGLPPTPSNAAPAYSTQSGLQISVDTTWVGNRGYRPVQVSFTSAKPLAADVQITVRLHAGFWPNEFRSISVEQDLEMPLGASSVSATLLVPQYIDWGGYGWEVWVDGKKDKQLSILNMGFNQSNPGSTRYTALIPFPTTGIGRQVVAFQGTGNVVGPFQGLSQNNIDAFTAGGFNLPEKWVGYTNLDLLIITPDELEQWSKNSPQQLAEMLRWVRAGGNLWVFEVGEEFAAISRLESAVGLDLRGPSFEQRGWRFLPLRGGARQGADALVLLEGRRKKDLKQTASPTQEVDSQSIEFAADSRNWFVARAYGMGVITAFRKSCRELLPQGVEQTSTGNATMEAVRKSVLNERLNWSQRHGNDPGLENRGFNEWLIPDVGAAPVFEFQLLISLFVIGIGPLNYWLLKRRGQLPLMLVTVPVAALVATVLLFTYGILSDGFGTRVRVRSVTLIDQAAGEATCWARMSYYAGLAPAEGLTLLADTVVYPIHPSRSSTEGYSQHIFREQREVEWGEQQKLTRGWLASRTPTQYLSISARASQKQLLFEPQGEQLSVTNGLGVEIVWLAVQDHAGNFYVGENIAAGKLGQLEKSEFSAALSQVRTMITDNIPELPAGYVVSQRRESSWQDSQLLESYSLSNNLMEAQINSVVSPLAKGWGNGTYIAITAAGPELSLGVADAIESNSLHVVRGSWSNE